MLPLTLTSLQYKSSEAALSVVVLRAFSEQLVKTLSTQSCYATFVPVCELH